MIRETTEVTQATTEGTHFFPLRLVQKQEVELDAILVAYQESLEAQEVQEVPGTVDLVDQRELQDHQRR